MRAAVFQGQGRLDFENRPVPHIHDDDDVVLEVGGVGICGTDLHILDVPPHYPARVGVVLGHEFAGRVVAVGRRVTGVKPGDHVVVDENAPCGACEMCRRGMPNACVPLYETPEAPGVANSYGIFKDGGLAKYVLIKERNVVPISKSVPMWQAAVAEPLACVINGCNKANLRPGESAVVLGAGPIGLLFISMLKASGAAPLIAVEPSASRRQAAVACGATAVIDSRAEDVKQRIAAETGGRGAQVVIEAVGPLIDLCVEIAGPGGRIVQIGYDESAWVKVPPARIVYRELQIFGTVLAKFTFEPARCLLENGALPLDKIVTHRLPLESVHEGIDLLRRGEAIKVVVHPSEF
jgi:threonine dehydrogenase-like Zn-dependent dehydrogenase